jgi:hypothetical protein
MQTASFAGLHAARFGKQHTTAAQHNQGPAMAPKAPAAAAAPAAPAAPATPTPAAPQFGKGQKLNLLA